MLNFCLLRENSDKVFEQKNYHCLFGNKILAAMKFQEQLEFPQGATVDQHFTVRMNVTLFM